MLKGILPHNTALLGNFLFIGVYLLLSSAADASIFLVGQDIRWLRIISSALFCVILLPFLESAWRYLVSLYWEVRWDREWFGEQYNKATKKSQ